MTQERDPVHREGAPRFRAGLSSLVADYDGFLVDQWGVLHDGRPVRPAVRAALERLRERGRGVVLVSNSARRSASNEETLAELGVPRALYDGIVTSGELLFQGLQARAAPPFAGLGHRALVLARGGDEARRALLDGTGLVLATEDEADLVLLASLELDSTVAGLDPLLRRAQARGLPLFCANRDRVSLYGSSGRGLGPGVIAERYAQLGGTVHAFGKPDPALLRAGLALLPRAGRVLVVGDSLEHDVAAAAAAGLPAALCLTGVLAPSFPPGQAPEEAARVVAALASEVRGGALPRYLLRGFAWGDVE